MEGMGLLEYGDRRSLFSVAFPDLYSSGPEELPADSRQTETDS
jgi:hypothetical protein